MLAQAILAQVETVAVNLLGSGGSEGEAMACVTGGQNAVLVMVMSLPTGMQVVATSLAARNATRTRIDTRKWIERNMTFDAEDNTTSKDPCNRHDSWEYSNETFYGCEVT